MFAMTRSPKSKLVAGNHVLSCALQAQDRVRDQWQTPQLAVVLAQVVGGNHGANALQGSNRIRASNRGVGSIQVGRLDFSVAHALLPGEPVLPGEQRGVGV